MDKKLFSLSTNRQFLGKKFCWIFFSTTCVYCQANLANFKELNKEYFDKAAFVIVGIDRKESDLREFAKQNPDVVVAIDNKRLAKNAYEIFATPTTVVIDSNKKVVFFSRGCFIRRR
jgi:thioredoxin-related protein